ncbi:MAG: hypothetical protein K1060chlam5_00211 [Candidatus Anoxychlamydiales bacterium]|nr:hypothetical protein [Candidatus Anoxychlamydiales bacterium]
MNIAIIGCGYLGRALANTLVKKNNFVTATTRNPSSIKKICDITQKTKVVDSSDENEILLLLKENDVIIVTIFSEDINEYEKAYLEASANIKKAAKEIKEKKRIIFISQSIVYGNHSGKWVDEDSTLNATDDYPKKIIEAEKTYLSLKGYDFDITILRLARVYGPHRELEKLAKIMLNNSLKGDSSFYTNMVHLDDAVNTINFVLDHNLYGIFNVVDDDHITRKELLDKICKKLNISKISWDDKKNIFDDVNKRVSNYRIKETGFTFKYPFKEI